MTEYQAKIGSQFGGRGAGYQSIGEGGSNHAGTQAGVQVTCNTGRGGGMGYQYGRGVGVDRIGRGI